MSGRPRFLTIGRICGPRGAKGEVKVETATDFPHRFSPGQKVFLQGQPCVIMAACPWKKGFRLMLEGISGREQAESLRGLPLEVPIQEAMPLEEGEYYYFQVIGLEVWTTAGERLGKVVDILANPANDVYVVRQGPRQYLIPAIADVVKEVDLKKGRMVIEVMAGLLETSSHPSPPGTDETV